MYVKRLAITAAGALVAAIAVAYGLLSWHRQANPVVPPPLVEELPEALVVYCFYNAERGPDSRKIERLAQETLEQSFDKELEDGRIKWLIVNYQHPNNRFVIAQYDIRKPCIVVVDGRPGKNRVWKNHEQKVWELRDDEKAFKDYLRAEIEKALKS